MTLVYVLRSLVNRDKYYVGLTTALELRLVEHNSGRCFHTAKHRPWELTVCVAFAQREQAVRFERYLKSGSGRAFARRHF